MFKFERKPKIISSAQKLVYKDNKILAIIPARGGSKGIPRKNIRFLNQNPLIAYIIKTSTASNYIDKTIVTTDDEEISNIARIYGADEIIKRPKNLADDKTTLDPVVYHAYQAILEQEKERFDLVITLQPTSPLLTSESLDKAIMKLVDQEFSTVISGISIRHLFWEKKGENLHPYHPKRLNRQELEPVFFETGSFVISKADLITENSRIFEPIAIFELDETEAIDIDTYLDWEIAEKILSRKKFLIRVDGNNEIGMGHIYNTLIMADNLVSHDIKFVMNKNSRLGIQKIAQYNYPIVEIDNEEEFFVIIEKEKPDIVILDILDTTDDYIKNIMNNDLFLVSIEDLGAALGKADLVFNAIYEYDKSSVEQNVFSGYPYVCLRDEFFILPFKTISEEVKNILITFGGIDQNDLTNLCLDVFKELKRPEIEITIITGLGYQNKDKLLINIDQMKNNGFKVNFLQDIKFISRHMHEADLVITSNGRTVFEIGSLGVPCISIAQNERETHHTFAQTSDGVLYLGLAEEKTSEKLKKTLIDLIDNQDKRRDMNHALSKYDLLNGIRRVIRTIFDRYEKKFPSNLLNIS